MSHYPNEGRDSPACTASTRAVLRAWAWQLAVIAALVLLVVPA